jgi:putative transposase
MPTKKYKPEQIVSLLRQIEVAVANGKSTPQGCRDAGISEQSYYRWRKEYGGLRLDQAKRLKELEKENLSSSAWWQNCGSRSRSLKRLPRETSKPRAAPGRSAACARKVPAE